MRRVRSPSASPFSMRDQVVERGSHVLAQRVDGAADVEDEAGLAVQVDALREIAGNRGIDDAADRKLELFRHLLHGGVTFGGGALFLGRLFLGGAGRLVGVAAGLFAVGRGFLLGLAAGFFRQHQADVVDGAGGLADLVAALGAGDLDLLALGHALQERDQRAHRLDDAELRHRESKCKATGQCRWRRRRSSNSKRAHIRSPALLEA